MAAHETRIVLLAAGLLLTACAGPGEDSRPASGETVEPFLEENRDWRQRRLDRLTEPHGWLSLVALEFIDDGRYVVGSGLDAELRLPAGPARWGVLEISAGNARFTAAADARVTADGEPVQTMDLARDGSALPVRLESDRIQWQLLNRGDGFAVRVRDPQAPSRVNFAGLDHYPLDARWRIAADFQAHEDGRTIPIANVLGDLIDEPNPGAVVFTADGRSHRLEAVASGDGEQLFFIFADRTSGRETYGLGRFLYADWPRGGKVVLDFNQAYNPPCAFSEYTTCPLPPPENRLDLHVTAGEKKYRGKTGLSPDSVQNPD